MLLRESGDIGFWGMSGWLRKECLHGTDHRPVDGGLEDTGCGQDGDVVSRNGNECVVVRPGWVDAEVR